MSAKGPKKDFSSPLFTRSLELGQMGASNPKFLALIMGDPQLRGMLGEKEKQLLWKAHPEAMKEFREKDSKSESTQEKPEDHSPMISPN